MVGRYSLNSAPGEADEQAPPDPSRRAQRIARSGHGSGRRSIAPAGMAGLGRGAEVDVVAWSGCRPKHSDTRASPSRALRPASRRETAWSCHVATWFGGGEESNHHAHSNHDVGFIMNRNRHRLVPPAVIVIVIAIVIASQSFSGESDQNVILSDGPLIHAEPTGGEGPTIGTPKPIYKIRSRFPSGRTQQNGRRKPILTLRSGDRQGEAGRAVALRHRDAQRLPAQTPRPARREQSSSERERPVAERSGRLVWEICGAHLLGL